jgi:hypothetical protein
MNVPAMLKHPGTWSTRCGADKIIIGNRAARVKMT